MMRAVVLPSFALWARRAALGALPFALMCAGSAASADVVSLKDGEKVEGIATERGDEVDVRLDVGTITFAKSEILSIERSDTPLAAFEKRADALGDRDVEGHYRLGLEAEKAGFGAFARGLYRRVIELSADHKGARAALGYKRHEGAWLTEDEYMIQQGYVRHGSGWVTREAAAAIEKLDAERRAIEEEARTREASEARVRALEAQVQRLEAERSEQASGQGVAVWMPYWNGHAYSHRNVGGFGVSITGSASGVRGQVQIGGAPRGGASVPVRGGSNPAPAPRPAVKSGMSGR